MSCLNRNTGGCCQTYSYCSYFLAQSQFCESHSCSVNCGFWNGQCVFGYGGCSAKNLHQYREPTLLQKKSFSKRVAEENVKDLLAKKKKLLKKGRKARDLNIMFNALENFCDPKICKKACNLSCGKCSNKNQTNSEAPINESTNESGPSASPNHKTDLVPKKGNKKSKDDKQAITENQANALLDKGPRNSSMSTKSRQSENILAPKKIQNNMCCGQIFKSEEVTEDKKQYTELEMCDLFTDLLVQKFKAFEFANQIIGSNKLPEKISRCCSKCSCDNCSCLGSTELKDIIPKVGIASGALIKEGLSNRNNSTRNKSRNSKDLMLIPTYSDKSPMSRIDAPRQHKLSLEEQYPIDARTSTDVEKQALDLPLESLLNQLYSVVDDGERQIDGKDSQESINFKHLPIEGEKETQRLSKKKPRSKTNQQRKSDTTNASFGSESSSESLKIKYGFPSRHIKSDLSFDNRRSNARHSSTKFSHSVIQESTEDTDTSLISDERKSIKIQKPKPKSDSKFTHKHSTSSSDQRDSKESTLTSDNNSSRTTMEEKTLNAYKNKTQCSISVQTSESILIGLLRDSYVSHHIDEHAPRTTTSHDKIQDDQPERIIGNNSYRHSYEKNLQSKQIRKQSLQRSSPRSSERKSHNDGRPSAVSDKAPRSSLQSGCLNEEVCEIRLSKTHQEPQEKRSSKPERSLRKSTRSHGSDELADKLQEARVETLQGSYPNKLSEEHRPSAMSRIPLPKTKVGRSSHKPSTSFSKELQTVHSQSENLRPSFQETKGARSSHRPHDTPPNYLLEDQGESAKSTTSSTEVEITSHRPNELIEEHRPSKKSTTSSPQATGGRSSHRSKGSYPYELSDKHRESAKSTTSSTKAEVQKTSQRPNQLIEDHRPSTKSRTLSQDTKDGRSSQRSQGLYPYELSDKHRESAKSTISSTKTNNLLEDQGESATSTTSSTEVENASHRPNELIEEHRPSKKSTTSSPEASGGRSSHRSKGSYPYELSDKHRESAKSTTSSTKAEVQKTSQRPNQLVEDHRPSTKSRTLSQDTKDGRSSQRSQGLYPNELSDKHRESAKSTISSTKTNNLLEDQGESATSTTSSTEVENTSHRPNEMIEEHRPSKKSTTSSPEASGGRSSLRSKGSYPYELSDKHRESAKSTISSTKAEVQKTSQRPNQLIEDHRPSTKSTTSSQETKGGRTSHRPQSSYPSELADEQQESSNSETLSQEAKTLKSLYSRELADERKTSNDFGKGEAYTVSENKDSHITSKSHTKHTKCNCECRKRNQLRSHVEELESALKNQSLSNDFDRRTSNRSPDTTFSSQVTDRKSSYISSHNQSKHSMLDRPFVYTRESESSHDDAYPNHDMYKKTSPRSSHRRLSPHTSERKDSIYSHSYGKNSIRDDDHNSYKFFDRQTSTRSFDRRLSPQTSDIRDSYNYSHGHGKESIRDDTPRTSEKKDSIYSRSHGKNSIRDDDHHSHNFFDRQTSTRSFDRRLSPRTSDVRDSYNYSQGHGKDLFHDDSHSPYNFLDRQTSTRSFDQKYSHIPSQGNNAKHSIPNENHFPDKDFYRKTSTSIRDDDNVPNEYFDRHTSTPSLDRKHSTSYSYNKNSISDNDHSPYEYFDRKTSIPYFDRKYSHLSSYGHSDDNRSPQGYFHKKTSTPSSDLNNSHIPSNGYGKNSVFDDHSSNDYFDKHKQSKHSIREGHSAIVSHVIQAEDLEDEHLPNNGSDRKHSTHTSSKKPSNQSMDIRKSNLSTHEPNRHLESDSFDKAISNIVAPGMDSKQENDFPGKNSFDNETLPQKRWSHHVRLKRYYSPQETAQPYVDLDSSHHNKCRNQCSYEEFTLSVIKSPHIEEVSSTSTTTQSDDRDMDAETLNIQPPKGDSKKLGTEINSKSTKTSHVRQMSPAKTERETRPRETRPRLRRICEKQQFMLSFNRCRGGTYPTQYHPCCKSGSQSICNEQKDKKITCLHKCTYIMPPDHSKQQKVFTPFNCCPRQCKSEMITVTRMSGSGSPDPDVATEQTQATTKRGYNCNNGAQDARHPERIPCSFKPSSLTTFRLQSDSYNSSVPEDNEASIENAIRLDSTEPCCQCDPPLDDSKLNDNSTKDMSVEEMMITSNTNGGPCCLCATTKTNPIKEINLENQKKTSDNSLSFSNSDREENKSKSKSRKRKHKRRGK